MLRKLIVKVMQRSGNRIHFEGPYLDAEKRGAQPLSCIQTQVLNNLKNSKKLDDNLIKLITIAY